MAQTGSWWGLHSIYEEARQLQQAWRENPLPSCPNDGEPLTAGPDGVRFCQFDGWRETDRQPTD
jgi:hypothetical protein